MRPKQTRSREHIAFCRDRKSGFTLAELLVSLLILAEIATFTIPKVLSSQQAGQKKAIFKETIATLFELTNKAKLDPITNVGNASLELQFYRNNLNYVKECATDPGAQGCMATGVPYSDAINTAAFVLPNGAVISSLNGGAVLPGRETIDIDWNGPTGPNVYGDDILSVTVCYGPSACNADISPIVMGPTGPGGRWTQYHGVSRKHRLMDSNF